MEKKADTIAWIAFTAKGARLMEHLTAALGGRGTCAHGNTGFSLEQWTRSAFAASRALVFIGAAGIAVRAIAPLLNNKSTDPAVIVLDENGRFVIPLVSGHLGGANRLAHTIAHITDGDAVITTATDVNGIFAADSWAKTQGLRLLMPERIKGLSARLLSGGTLTVYSAFPITGSPPENVVVTTNPLADVAVDIRHQEDASLLLVPPVLVLGVGCRRGTPSETLFRVFRHFTEIYGILPQALDSIASITLKQDEAGLHSFAQALQLPLSFFTPEELLQTPGTFTQSDFVAQVTGVDNVCERSAVRKAGGTIIIPKYIEAGVTLALAAKPVQLDWSW